MSGGQCWRLCKAHMCGEYAVAVAEGGGVTCSIASVAVAEGGGVTCSNASVEMAGNLSYPVNGCAQRTM
jgi:hypothetical protein